MARSPVSAPGLFLSLRVLLGASLVATCGALVLASSSEASEAPLTYVGCGLERATAPSHLCHLGDGNEFGAFFQSATEVTYSVCVEFPTRKTLCVDAQRAAPGTLYVNKIRVGSLTGTYRVTWLVDDQQVGAWSFRVPIDPPAFGKTATLRPISGTVLIKEPAGAFQPLDGASIIRMRSVIDTTHGKVQLVTASSPSGGLQSGRFYGGAFRIGQATTRSRFLGGRRALTLLKLVGELPRCGKRSHPQRLARSRRRGGRRRWGNAHGNFQTGGRYATVTVRGSSWLTEDTCAGTRVRVVRGMVNVRDLPHRRNVLLRAPDGLLVRPGGSDRRRRDAHLSLGMHGVRGLYTQGR
jgi:hypothetical protein